MMHRRRRQQHRPPVVYDFPAYPMRELMADFNQMPPEWQALVRDYGMAAEEIYAENNEVPVMSNMARGRQTTAAEARKILERTYGRPI